MDICHEFLNHNMGWLSEQSNILTELRQDDIKSILKTVRTDNYGELDRLRVLINWLDANGNGANDDAVFKELVQLIRFRFIPKSSLFTTAMDLRPAELQ